MAAPNIISATSIIGKTNANWITITPTAILNNPNNSSQVFRINSLYVSNLGAQDATVTVDFYRGGTAYAIVNASLVSVGTSSVPIAKDTGIYLEEGDQLRIAANLAGILQYVISYEVMS